MTYVNPYAWLGDLKPGDYVRVCHVFQYPKGKRKRVHSVNSLWVDLESGLRFSRDTGRVGHKPWFSIEPWQPRQEGGL